MRRSARVAQHFGGGRRLRFRWLQGLRRLDTLSGLEEAWAECCTGCCTGFGAAAWTGLGGGGDNLLTEQRIVFKETIRSIGLRQMQSLARLDRSMQT